MASTNQADDTPDFKALPQEQQALFAEALKRSGHDLGALGVTQPATTPRPNSVD